MNNKQVILDQMEDIHGVFNTIRVYSVEIMGSIEFAYEQYRKTNDIYYFQQILDRSSSFLSGIENMVKFGSKINEAMANFIPNTSKTD